MKEKKKNFLCELLLQEVVLQTLSNVKSITERNECMGIFSNLLQFAIIISFFALNGRSLINTFCNLQST